MARGNVKPRARRPLRSAEMQRQVEQNLRGGAVRMAAIRSALLGAGELIYTETQPGNELFPCERHVDLLRLRRGAEAFYAVAEWQGNSHEMLIYPDLQDVTESACVSNKLRAAARTARKGA